MRKKKNITWHKLSQAKHSKIHFDYVTEEKRVVRYKLEDGHPPQHQPIFRTAKTCKSISSRTFR